MSTDQKIEELLPQFKAKMLITWEDDITDTKIRGALEGAIGHLESLTGTSIEFRDNIFARNLVMDCARYYYNNVSEFFEENFHKEITRLSIEEATKRMG